MKLKSSISLFLVIITVITTSLCFASCSKKDETTSLTSDINQKEDADDDSMSLVEEISKSNIIILTDNSKNNYSVVPIFDVTGKIIIAGLVVSATDKNGKEITDKSIIGNVLAVTTDEFGIHSITLKNDVVQYLKFYNDENGLIKALESATDGKYYEVTSTKDDAGTLTMQLTADENGNPIEVVIKKDGTKTQIVEKTTAKTTSKNSSTNTSSKKDEVVSTDKVVSVEDYGSLADINVVLTKNTTASVGLASDSPVKVSVTNKAYVKGGVLYLQGNGDYYITQSTDLDKWYGKIVCNLGNKGLARIRFAGVNISSSDSYAVQFVDTDSVINDTESDSEVLIKYDNTSTSKNNPNAVLSFVTDTTNTFSASGNSAKGSGTIYSQCKLSIQGHGTANIKATNKNGIQGSRSVGIQNATINITADAAKGIRVSNLLDIEENATINIDSMGDAIRCGEFLMDVDKDANGNKDLSTGSKVTINTVSGSVSPTSGDGVDADDSAIIRAGTLDINVQSTKSKYGVKVRRVDNEEFIKIIKSENISDIASWKESNSSSPYYADVVLNEKEYASLVKVANTSSESADYQGVRTSTGYTDTFRITGGTVFAQLKLGRNTNVVNSTNSQYSVNAITSSVVRTISIGNKTSSDTVRAMLYSSSALNENTSVVYAKAGKTKEKTVTPTFSGKAGKATDA